jgi:hypothetical protein
VVKIDYVMSMRLKDIIEDAKTAQERAQAILDRGTVEYAEVAEICDLLHNAAAMSRP